MAWEAGQEVRISGGTFKRARMGVIVQANKGSGRYLVETLKPGFKEWFSPCGTLRGHVGEPDAFRIAAA